MASSGIRRKVDDLGRVVIPAGMRRTLGIREGDPVEVSVEGERVVLAKPRYACVFCGREEEDLTGFRGRLVCRDCLASLGSVEERLRATDAAADPEPVAPPSPRRAADLPDWDAPRTPRREPAPAPAPWEDRHPGPAPASLEEHRPQQGPQHHDGEDEARRRDDPAADVPPRPRRRPPYDPASTTAW